MVQDTAKSSTKVLIVDDHPVILSGCRALFAGDASILIEEAADAKSGQRAYAQKKPDVTVIDINLPDVSGFELMRRIRKDDPDAKIIMFSMNNDPAFVVRAVELGAQGYVSKADDPRVLVRAVRKVAAGDNFISPDLAEAVTFSSAAIKANPASQMTARELEILRLLGARRQDRRGRRCARHLLQDGGQHHLSAEAEARRQEPLRSHSHRGRDAPGLDRSFRNRPRKPGN